MNELSKPVSAGNRIAQWWLPAFPFRLLAATALSLLLSVSRFVGAAATGEGDHDHRELPVDPELTLSAALDGTLERFPDTVELAARANEAEAWRDRGKSFIADSPSLSFRYQTDRWADDNRLQEFESGIEFLLWRWGERVATQSLGLLLSTESQAAADALRWEVAGLLRSALWDVALAHAEFELAEEALAISQRLTAAVERRYDLGDVAMTDVLLAQSANLEAQNSSIAARAALLDAERAYRSLTQLEYRPPFQAEDRSAQEDVSEAHPALAFAHAAYRRAEVKRTVVEKAARGNPALQVGQRRERPAFGTGFEDSIGFSIRVPFGGGAHTRAESATASREVSAARAALLRERRALDLEMHEAAHNLAVVNESLEAATERADLAGRHYKLGESAYEQGELDLIDLLKLQTIALEARRNSVNLQIKRKRHIALYNQAVGELP